MKLVATNWKYLKYLFWLGPILIVMGLSAGLVAASWGAIPLGLILAGAIVIGAWLVLSGQSIRGFWGRRSTQAGTNALVATLAMLVILGLLNFLGVRYGQRVDLTENQLFTLAPQSVTVLKGLQKPVKVWVFEAAPDPQDQELLERYQRQNQQLTYEYANPQEKPGIAQKFGVQSFGEVYLESGEKRRFLQMVAPDQPEQPGQRLSELSLTNGLAQVNSDRPLKIYFLQGHGEKTLQAGREGLSQAVTQLGQAGYTVEPLNLTTQAKVPDDALVLVVAGPQRELLAAEIEVLQAYLKRKSGLMLLLDPLAKSGLSDLLKQWGVTLSDRVILDPAGEAFKLGLTVTVVNQYGEHPITQELGDGYSLFPIAQPLQIDDTASESEIPLLFTSQQAQAQQVSPQGELNFDPNSPPQGPLAIGVALSRPVTRTTNQATDQTTEKPASPSPAPSPSSSPSPSDQDDPTQDGTQAEARMVVIGSSSFAVDGLFNQQLNSDIFLNSMTWLSQQENQALSIRPKEITNRRILLNSQQQLAIGVGALAILPLLGFGAAFFSWWRRR
jgi:ABC-type uncharacterized transport system involved in gliding motility auxiliary subunit